RAHAQRLHAEHAGGPGARVYLSQVAGNDHAAEVEAGGVDVADVGPAVACEGRDGNRQAQPVGLQRGQVDQLQLLPGGGCVVDHRHIEVEDVVHVGRGQ